ncbi:MAG: cupredoxin domain-containing protein [Candidatus Doudnabacteria bacterium]|nr:cupredoxin domain-containing protein [Candidatus Doudnabacteria bacterium]
MEEDNAQNGNQEPSGESAKGIIIALIVLIIAGGAYFFVKRSKEAQKGSQERANEQQAVDDLGKKQAEEPVMEESPSPSPGPSASATPNPTPVMQGEVKTFTVEAKNFSFSPSEIKVKKGVRVKIILNNTQGFHDWVLDEFDAKTKQVMGPATAEAEFIASKTGRFEYYCSVGQHREMGMKGNLVVE